MNILLGFFKYLYAYCTDFVINISNLLNLSYYEVNFFVFCILYPGLIIGLSAYYANSREKLRRLEAAKNNTINN
jgi:hypothetical protein